MVCNWPVDSGSMPSDSTSAVSSTVKTIGGYTRSTRFSANLAWPWRIAIGVTTKPLTRKNNGTAIWPMPCSPMCMGSLVNASMTST